MRVQVLYSGGKDSSLSAVLLEPFFEVELVTCTFGSDAWRHAEKAARALGFPFRTMVLSPEIMDECIDLILRHGYPRYGISFVHRRALEALAAGSEYIADGTRRDDHSPMLTMSEVRSLEMRFGVSYIRPLAGYGRRAIDALVRRHFEIIEGPDIEKSDYEAEIRSSIKERYGEETVRRLFPTEHAQSRVMRRL
ncbi:putative subunit of tRNA(5-methylaminomethyl-2-thiouridylate) methyltransferase [Methanocella conradii HZ254]|uniref:Subunit of tRNA(5-methylaminomethyl-2-thiouridylate) methyltransferase n=1 Tax=Methanocella conradii (strain DSM 24694 / JCM 17849 / CGMCC 1.5162 / HZ254) TaxID=1041930 RepID=H8I464_METCZ|nr:alpha hydrolase [Methanocella conradii]AFC99203.1 putative subunit of tRNA(5-methylaminomethyl-2-thiouridylate) methyltransferase [Methanocella conradii HZ254]